MENSPLSEIGGSKGARGVVLKMLEVSDSDFNWILLLICSLFIVYIVYSLLEHY